MPKINEDQLREKVSAGAVSIMSLREALAFELDHEQILTIPTLGNDDQHREREAAARTRLDRAEQDAAHNVPILRSLLAEQGTAENISVCRRCEKHFARRLHGGICANCFEVDDNA